MRYKCRVFCGVLSSAVHRVTQVRASQPSIGGSDSGAPNDRPTDTLIDDDCFTPRSAHVPFASTLAPHTDNNTDIMRPLTDEELQTVFEKISK